MKITKELLEQHHACGKDLEWAEQQGLIGQELKPFITGLMEGGKYNWSVWLITRLLTKEQNVQLAIYSAELVLPIFEAAYPLDLRPRTAIDIAKAWQIKPYVITRDAASAFNAASAYNSASASYKAASAFNAAYNSASASYVANATVNAVAYNTYTAAAIYAAASYEGSDRTNYKEIIEYGMNLLEEKAK